MILEAYDKELAASTDTSLAEKIAMTVTEPPYEEWPMFFDLP